MGGSRNSEFVVSSDSPGVVALGAHPSDGDTDLSVSAPLSARQKSQLGEPQYHAALSPPVPDASVLQTALFEECWSISLADDSSTIWADASRSVDPIGTSDCVARLGEHEHPKCNHDGEHRYAISGEAQQSVFHF